MKKYLLIFAVLVALSGHAQAAVTTPVYVPVSAAPIGVLFPVATVTGFTLVYLIATGVPFPLCGVGGLKCYYTYPGDK